MAHALALLRASAPAFRTVLMLYSDEATSKFAMTAHFGVFARRSVPAAQPDADGHGRHRAAHARRTELQLATRRSRRASPRAPPSSKALNADLRREIGVRHGAEVRTLMQLERLDLLRRITHAIAERQDLASIIQVVVRSVEEHLPADFARACATTSAMHGSLAVKPRRRAQPGSSRSSWP